MNSLLYLYTAFTLAPYHEPLFMKRVSKTNFKRHNQRQKRKAARRNGFK